MAGGLAIESVVGGLDRPASANLSVQGFTGRAGIRGCFFPFVIGHGFSFGEWQDMQAIQTGFLFPFWE
jgi:hypothetical protein